MKFIPTYTHHLARYVFALDYCYKRKVLDAGCKDGHTSQILSFGCKELDLADIDETFLHRAKTNVKYHCPVNFHQVDFEKAFPEGMWDTIIAMEVIEHLANPELFIENAAKHLNPGGLLVFSVPHMVANHEHKTLFDEMKIKELVSKDFNMKEFYVQDKKLISNAPMYKGLKCYVGVAEKK